MNILNLLENLDVISVIEMFCIIMLMSYAFMKIMNVNSFLPRNVILSIISSLFISIITIIIKRNIDAYYSLLFLIFFTGFMNSIIFKNDLIHSFLVTIISLCISYMMYIVSVFIAFIPKKILDIKNDYIGMILILTIFTILMTQLLKIKKIKHGIIFFREKIGKSIVLLLIIFLFELYKIIYFVYGII